MSCITEEPSLCYTLSIQSKLRDMGLKLGMDLKNMSDEEFNAHVERLKRTQEGQALLCHEYEKEAILRESD